MVGFLGAVAGFLVGHLLSAAGSVYLQQTIGEGIHWQRFDPDELGYVAVVVVLAFLAGLVPALAAYRTPVATNLVAA